MVFIQKKNLQSFVICLSKDLIGLICIFTRSSLGTHRGGCKPHSRCSLQVCGWVAAFSPSMPPRWAVLRMAGFASHSYRGDLVSNIHHLLPSGPGTITARVPSPGPERGSGVGDRSGEGRSVLPWCKGNHHTRMHNIVYPPQDTWSLHANKHQKTSAKDCVQFGQPAKMETKTCSKLQQQPWSEVKKMLPEETAELGWLRQEKTC